MLMMARPERLRRRLPGSSFRNPPLFAWTLRRESPPGGATLPKRMGGWEAAVSTHSGTFLDFP